MIGHPNSAARATPARICQVSGDKRLQNRHRSNTRRFWRPATTLMSGIMTLVAFTGHRDAIGFDADHPRGYEGHHPPPLMSATTI